VVLVIKRKLRRKTGDQIIESVKKYEDPSFEIEKPKNPMDFTRASYAAGFRMKVLWSDIKISNFRLKEILGEPTIIGKNSIEWVIRIPTKEVIKLVLLSSSKVEIYGFNITKSIEKWVGRLEST